LYKVDISLNYLYRSWKPLL